MAKNQIENGVLLTNPPRTVGNRDHFQRMNYLYQLAFWQTVDGHDGEQALARLYAKNMDLVSKRTRAEMLPHVKRTICKRCKRVLVPLRTMQMGMHKKAFEMQCLCGKKRKFVVGLNKGYRCYAEREENLLSM